MRRTNDGLTEPAGSGGWGSAHADESDIDSYLDFARPPRPDDFAPPPAHGDDTADLGFPSAPASAPFADDATHEAFVPAHPSRDETGDPTLIPDLTPFTARPGYEEFVDDRGFEDTIVFPSAGAERPIRSHRRDEPGRRVAIRVMIASAVSGSGLAIVLAAAGGGTPPVVDVPAALPRVVTTTDGFPTATSTPTAPPTPSPEPTPTTTPATESRPTGAAQVRNAPRAPQGVGLQPDNEPTTPTSTPPATTDPTTTDPTTTDPEPPPPTTDPATPSTDPTTPTETETPTTPPASETPSPTGTGSATTTATATATTTTATMTTTAATTTTTTTTVESTV